MDLADLGRIRGDVVKAALAILLLLFSMKPASAHQADTSYTRFDLDGHRLAIEATFDLHVLGRIADVDRDGDQVITGEELRAVSPKIERYLRGRLLVSLDDAPPSLGRFREFVPSFETPISAGEWPQALVDFRFLREIEEHPDLLTLQHLTWSELGPDHTNFTRINQVGYPSLEVIFDQAEPDYDYFTSAPSSFFEQFAQYVRLGMDHIWSGIDHLLFLAVLLVVSRLRELLQIVTAFTVAHSITLSMAVLEFVELPSRLVEASIAATIVWVAYENLRGHSGRHRWKLTFGFGLVHGFGFANVLRELELPALGLLRSLAAFNVGVELGQVVVVAGLFPVFWLISRSRVAPTAVASVSVLVGLAGVVWLVERALGYSWMPV